MLPFKDVLYLIDESELMHISVKARELASIDNTQHDLCRDVWNTCNAELYKRDPKVYANKPWEQRYDTDY